MSGGLFTETDVDALFLSRSDVEEVLGAWSEHPFSLEDKEWPTVEHYYQAMKFEDESYQEKIRHADSAKHARKLGRRRFKKLRTDWKKVKVVYMTRALYTKCKTYPEIAKTLLETEGKRLVENNLYDYYWGCGRDRRGTNMYGQVLMNVRNRLKEESKPS